MRREVCRELRNDGIDFRLQLVERLLAVVFDGGNRICRAGDQRGASVAVALGGQPLGLGDLLRLVCVEERSVVNNGKRRRPCSAELANTREDGGVFAGIDDFAHLIFFRVKIRDREVLAFSDLEILRDGANNLDDRFKRLSGICEVVNRDGDVILVADVIHDFAIDGDVAVRHSERINAVIVRLDGIAVHQEPGGEEPVPRLHGYGLAGIDADGSIVRDFNLVFVNLDERVVGRQAGDGMRVHVDVVGMHYVYKFVAAAQHQPVERHDQHVCSRSQAFEVVAPAVRTDRNLELQRGFAGVKRGESVVERERRRP